MSSSCLEIYNGDAIRGAPPRQEHNLGGWPAPKLPLYRAAAVSSDGEDFCIVAAPATGESLLLWLWSGSKRKPTGAINQHPTCLVVRETGSELTPPLRLPSKPICDSSHVFVGGFS
jgi:hypothetical protein